ncbi:hypothetical protein Sjap_015260 [Stephania japonica]|uniref:Uncharacterized protein n=1 Tax=Stephania japonica TaxID=461633 RepID=A0AAP0IJV6_9MAGN
MGSQGNWDLNHSGYSSPVPLIGLYTAGATLVCLLFILLDVVAGFLNRKRWLPCRFFSLNSVTLTLLSVAVKLPLDLTSPMPRVLDQLSKLTGTTLICICMGFFMPSLGTYRESECFSNMAALSIFVVTIIVNVSIQMHTGVINLFRTEHIIILCCMMILLMILWYLAFDIHSYNEISHDGIKEFFVKSKKSMLYRLKVSYLCSYNSNPQLMLCRMMLSAVVYALCMISLVVILKVTFQALVFKKSAYSEESVSVYKWSIRIIVVSQIITIVIGSLAITFRKFSLTGHLLYKMQILQNGVQDAEYILGTNPMFILGCLMCFITSWKAAVKIFVGLIAALVAIPFAVLDGLISRISYEYESRGGGCLRSSDDVNEEVMEEFIDFVGEGDMKLDEWTLRKGVNDMQRWVEKIRASNQLIKLLTKRTPSNQAESPISQLKAHYDSVNPGYQISCLSIVLLVRIATISIPSSLSGNLLSSLDEVFEILLFVSRKMSSLSFENKRNSVIAKSLKAGGNFNYLLRKMAKKFKNDEAFQSQSQFVKAMAIIKGLKEVLPSDYVRDELEMMTDFIQCRAYETIEELYRYIEQLYVDMVKEFLFPLPKAILKEIVESNAEDIEKKVRFSLKVLCKMEPLEALVEWSFPVETTITDSVSDELPVV